MMGNSLQDALFLKTARFFSKPALKSAKQAYIRVKERQFGRSRSGCWSLLEAAGSRMHVSMHVNVWGWGGAERINGGGSADRTLAHTHPVVNKQTATHHQDWSCALTPSADSFALLLSHIRTLLVLQDRQQPLSFLIPLLLCVLHSHIPGFFSEPLALLLSLLAGNLSLLPSFFLFSLTFLSSPLQRWRTTPLQQLLSVPWLLPFLQVDLQTSGTGTPHNESVWIHLVPNEQTGRDGRRGKKAVYN